MPDTNRSLLLVNATAGGGEIDLDAIREQLSPLGPLVCPDCSAAETLGDAIREHAASVRRVLIFGGDGTLNSALPALLSTNLPLAYGPSMRSGKLIDDENIKTFSGRRVTVFTHHPVEVAADGELVTRTPAECHVLPGALKVFVPAQ